MSNETGMNRQLKRFDEVLAIYGADPTGWPADERETLRALMNSDRSAARAYDEAAALDKVMNYAPAGAPGPALKQRIVNAAIADGGRDVRVVPFSTRHTEPDAAMDSSQGALWPAAAMAASFALGLYLGVAGLGTTTVNQAIDMASFSAPIEDVENDSFMLDGNGSDQEGLL